MLSLPRVLATPGAWEPLSIPVVSASWLARRQLPAVTQPSSSAPATCGAKALKVPPRTFRLTPSLFS